MAKGRAAVGTEASAPDPEIPSSFVYIQDRIEADEIEAISGETGDSLTTRVTTSNEDEGQMEVITAELADLTQFNQPPHYSLRFSMSNW